MSSPLRRLASETAIYGVSTIAGRFLTFLLTPMYTNFLATEAYGEIANLYVIIAFLGLFCSLGFESAFIRYFSNDQAGRAVFRTSMLFVGLAATAVVTPMLFFASELAPWLGVDAPSIYLQMAVAIVALDALAVVPYALLRMLKRSRFFAVTRFASILINVVLNVVFVVYLDMGMAGIFWAGIASSAAALLFVVPVAVPWLRAKSSAAVLQKLLRFGLPTVPAALAAIALQLIDRPLIKEILGASGAADVGIYQACYRLAIPMMMFVTVFDYAWKPFFMDTNNRSSALFVRVHKGFAAVAMLLFLLVSWFVEYVVRAPGIGGSFFHEDYWGGLIVIPPVLLGYAFHGLFVVLMSNVYFHNKTSWLPFVTGLAAVVNVAVNLALIPVLGIFGAALATTAAYAIELVVMAFLVRSLDAPAYEWGKVSTLIVASIGVWFAVDTLFAEPSWTDAAVKFAAIIAFAGAMFAFKFFEADLAKSLFSRGRSSR